MSQSKDIIRWVIDCMMRHDDSITQELALTVEREARAEWGGQEVGYIRKACEGDRRNGRRPVPPEVAAAAVHQAAMTAVPTQRILDEHGVSRATLYRLLKRGNR